MCFHFIRNSKSKSNNITKTLLKQYFTKFNYSHFTYLFHQRKNLNTLTKSLIKILLFYRKMYKLKSMKCAISVSGPPTFFILASFLVNLKKNPCRIK